MNGRPRVLLLRPDARFATAPAPPLGLGYLVRALLNEGFDAEIFDPTNRLARKASLASAIAGRPPVLVGLQVYTREVDQARRMVGEVRAATRAPLVVGGPHVSTMPEEALDRLDADFAVVGEAERALPLLARRLAGAYGVRWEAVPGLVRRDGEATVANPRDAAVDVDAIGFPAWERMRLKGYDADAFGGGFARRSPSMLVQTSRGCPFRCAFCAVGAVSGHALRLRNADAVAEEMAVLRRDWGYREIKIVDDTFNADRRHVLAVADAMRRRKLDVSVALCCGTRERNLDDDVLDAFRAMGVYEVAIAVESGSPRVLRRMRKDVDLDALPDTVARVRKRGFAVTGLFILGYPGETPEEIERTVRLALRLPFHYAHFNAFTPFPGSAIHDELRAAGTLRFDPRHAHFDTPEGSYVEGMTAGDLRRVHRRALRRFYLRPRALWAMARGLRRGSSLRFFAAKTLDYLRA